MIDTILILPLIFNAKIREACQKAMDSFREKNAICAYIDDYSGARCVNTKAGHAKGHQTQTGAFMRSGPYQEEECSINTEFFMSSIEDYIKSLIQKFTAEAPADQGLWRKLAAEEHRKNIRRLRLEGAYPKQGRAERDDPFTKTSVCYGCLFRHSEYLLPCGHTVCETCIRSNSEINDQMKYTGKHRLGGCVICGTSIGSQWPYEVRLRPLLSGLRILSLDGGGVRNIVQLITLRRLESLIGLDLPIGHFFDLIVGTGTGGVIALGLGVQNRSAKSFVNGFKNICEAGFAGKHYNKSNIMSFLSWISMRSIYFTDNLENALEKHFQRRVDGKVFGLQNHCRVAVTTTVEPSSVGLICNYKRGGIGKYLNSDLYLSHAARCTSAAPPYFLPKQHGSLCRDGGLKEGNPIRLAVVESKSIWGQNSSYDVLVSVGPGVASKPQDSFIYKRLKDKKWARDLIDSFLRDMNGEEEWAKFRESTEEHIIGRSSRLNIYFSQEVEPGFDDVSMMEEMESEAQRYTAFEKPNHGSSFAPINGIPRIDVLDTLADRLRATLFFLEVDSIDTSDVFLIIIKGVIRCRLGPGDSEYSKLLDMVSSFRVEQEILHKIPSPQEYFGLKIQFSHESIEEAIRIDVNFGKEHWVAISGCPITIKKIMEEWDHIGAQDDTGTQTPRTDDASESGFDGPP
ncbi:hypothetical protein AOL_s00076g162 [Orbilia oligospora ATCC 24927]|uniref:PNPLA domain-containing protein n=1 Tax=Arthrobotrys oligospora (strain ATCC 24927 / CBS 115.81 / DSM 1491) TaxID=756982 RepID=G1X955_ARTOA|nr:hypothetical protein AOL_s00076g162 [Orbilia oligospora ATCC 24927]EGX50398.1 hypothetical protein AOL_s00076g162 [Orbilia oligospora ATCC 24927]